MRNVIDILKERGFIEAMTSEDMREISEKPLKVYCGFDPTSDSLHLGNMVGIMALAWFQKCGHTPVTILGGATGMIGDPSGKSRERVLLDEATVQQNLIGIRKNFERILDFTSSNKTIMLNNFDWFKDYSFVNFLRDIGKNFRMGTMLAKDSVKSRLDSEEGMSFTEFCYQLLQAYDFLYLYDHYGVTVQIGGSDQWGNITAGKDLIRKLRNTTAHGVTFSLLTTSTGEKFGKTEKGAVWLSSDKLSPYEFYQYLYRVADNDVIKLMRLLTFMDMEEIKRYSELMKQSDYVPNMAQKKLAEEVTRLVHGNDGLELALRVTAGAAPGSSTKLNAQTLEALSGDIPSYTLNNQQVFGSKLVDIMVQLGLQPSKGEAKRLIRNKGVYLNNQAIEDENYTVVAEQLIEGRLLLLSVGKKNKFLIKIEN